MPKTACTPPKTRDRKAAVEAATREAVSNFDALPSSAIVRVRTVATVGNCSDQTVWNHVKNGLLAKPLKVGGLTGWRVADVRTWLGLPQ
ncbi:MAG: transcriptional regulator [Aquabacterium sp.]|uniref:helix-turn-helix transcriptional regulator n=1 Tax=Aquabacterium sp. TaxID=1872578 RepID=UPI003BB13C49